MEESFEIKTSVDGSHMRINIRNSGHLRNGVSRGSTGHGLKNTRDRLNLLYGEEASFDIRNDGSSSVVTEIVIPQSI